MTLTRHEATGTAVSSTLPLVDQSKSANRGDGDDHPDEPRSSGPMPDTRSLRRARAERTSRVALPLPWPVQSRRPALAEIIGGRRARTAVMICTGSMPWT